MEDTTIASQLTSFLSSPTMTSTDYSPSPSPSSEPPSTIKMEDLHQLPPPSSVPASPDAGTTSEQKPAKKRKSWGQVLPEPKTNLPPRKRAKTADEKEQRRIERVKRNRLAAHNSRERKRQEVEQLQAQKDELEQNLRATQQRMQEMESQLNIYKQLVPGGIPADMKPAIQSIDFARLTPPASDTESRSTINPTQTFETSPSMTSIDSPMDTDSQPPTPHMTPALSASDLTHHSAVMMCDLQCQSDSAQSSPSSSLSPTSLRLAIFSAVWLQIQFLTSLAFSISILSRTPATAMRRRVSSRLLSLLLPTPSDRLVFLMTWMRANSSLFMPTQALRQRSHATSLASKTPKMASSQDVKGPCDADDRQAGRDPFTSLLRLRMRQMINESTGRGSSISEEDKQELANYLGVNASSELDGREKILLKSVRR